MTEPAQQQNNSGDPAEAAAAAAAASAAAGKPADWYGAEQKDYVSNKGWKAPTEAVTAYQNLETLLGAEKAGRTVVLPKDDKDVEGMKAFRAKLGVPEKADGYQLPVPEGADPEFAKTAATWMHEAGVPMAAARAITEKWNGHFAKLVADMATTETAKAEGELAKVRAEWGESAAKNEELSRRFATEMGFSAEQFTAMERTVGTESLLKGFFKMGQRLAEPGAGGGDGGQGGDFRGGSKEAVKALADLQARRIAGTVSDAEYKRENERLGPIAYPDRAA